VSSAKKQFLEYLKNYTDGHININARSNKTSIAGNRQPVGGDESPVIFQFLRHDFDVVTRRIKAVIFADSCRRTFDGNAGDVIAVYNKTVNAMYGRSTSGSTTTIIDTDILLFPVLTYGYGTRR